MMKKAILLLACMALAVTAGAQKVAIKNNLVYDAVLTPNLGLEFAMGKKTSLDLSGNYNWYKINKDKNRMWKHWLVQPEFRFWTCERFNGGFWGIHALGGEFNFSNFKLPFRIGKNIRNHRYEGWFFGGGVSYGHQWILSKHWSFEATVGAGYARYYYEKYNSEQCEPMLRNRHRNYFGPTKLGLTFMFFL